MAPPAIMVDLRAERIWKVACLEYRTSRDSRDLGWPSGEMARFDMGQNWRAVGEAVLQRGFDIVHNIVHFH